MPNPFAWQFLNEPLWRWFAFLVVIGAMLATWHTLLQKMKVS